MSWTERGRGRQVTWVVLVGTLCLTTACGEKEEAIESGNPQAVGAGSGAPEAAEVRICPTCQRRYFAGERYCMYDQTALIAVDDAKASGKVCPVCGRHYPSNKNFCTTDGSSLEALPDKGAVAGGEAAGTDATAVPAETPRPDTRVAAVDPDGSSTGKTVETRPVSIATPEPVVRSTPTPRPTPEPVVRSTPTPRPTPEPVVRSTPTPRPTPEPVVRSTPTPRPTPEPVVRSTPTPRPTPEPVVRSTPTPRPTPEPVVRSTPTPRPTPEPVVRNTPAPVVATPTPAPVAVASKTKPDTTTKAVPPASTGGNPLKDFEQTSTLAAQGKLGASDVSALERVPSGGEDFTRAQSLLAMNYKNRDNAKYFKALSQIITVPENKYNPVYNLELAEYYLLAKKYKESVDQTRMVDRYKQRFPHEVYYQRVARMYEVEAKALEGQFNSTEDVQYLDKAISTWKRFVTHVKSNNDTERTKMAEDYVSKLEKIKGRMQ